MFRTIRIACALSVCLLVGVAMGAVRIPSFATTADAPAGASGMGILNYVAGQNETIVQVILNGFDVTVPGADYQYQFVSASQCFQPVGTFATDTLGNAIIHVNLIAPPATVDCPTPDGDWTDANILISLDGVLHASAY